MSLDSKSDLSRLLQEWQDVPDADPNLGARIEAAVWQKESPARSLRVAGLNWLAIVSLPAIGCLLGIGLIEWRESPEAKSRSRTPSEAYLAWIDPMTVKASTTGTP